MALTRIAHRLIREHFSQTPTGLAIDATCGNGHDTEFLARLGFAKVIGFDVQESAVNNTRIRLKNAQLDNAEVFHKGHECMDTFIEGELACAMFNFGYLPKADKSITTLSSTSLTALSVALKHLAKDGIICLICYPGHAEGAVETTAIQAWLQTLREQWIINEELSKLPNAETPVLYTIKAAD